VPVDRISPKVTFAGVRSFALRLHLRVSIRRSLTPFSAWRRQLGARLAARPISRNVTDFPEFLAINHKPYDTSNHQ
jgi:hypothetical protein